MKKALVGLFFSFLFVHTANSQQSDSLNTDSTWIFSGITSLNFSQVYLKNWAAGGEQSIAGNALINLSADYKKAKHSWENDLILGYGLVKMGKAHHQKSEDKIDLTSKYGREAFHKDWYYTALLNFKSQFAPGYNLPDDSNKISDFLSPAYGLLSLGLDYQPTENFSFFISPLTTKITLVKNQELADAGAYGVEPAQFNEEGIKVKDGENLFIEFGGYFKLEFNKELMSNVQYQTKLELFSSYSEVPTHVDDLWDNTLALKINKYISANITTSMIYDHDIAIAIDENEDGITDSMGPRTQFKETFALGIQYTFSK